MSDEQQPVEESEFVYRRIHHKHYDRNLPVPIQALAFRPNENDTTGLSVFRARFVHPRGTLANVETSRRTDYYVARLAVRDLIKLGLTFVPEPDLAGPSGHAVIPELSWDAYQKNKQPMKLVQVQLASLASADIVHSPNEF